jgi:hypothetical protein
MEMKQSMVAEFTLICDHPDCRRRVHQFDGRNFARATTCRAHRPPAGWVVQRKTEELWEISVNGRWCEVTWSRARSWSGPVRLNGQPWHGPACLFLHGLSNPYTDDKR